MDDAEQSNPAQAASLESASSTTAAVQAGEPVVDKPPPGGGAWIVLALSVTLALTFSFLCSIFESVLLSVSRGHVEAMAKRGSTAGKILKGWKRDDIEVPISAILILNTLAHTIGATVAGSSYESVFDASTLWLFSLLFTLAVLFFTEIIPKTLGVAFAHRLAAPVTFAVRAMVVVLKPVIFLTSKLSKALTGEGAKPVTSVEEIRLLAALGSREGVVGPRIAAFIEGVTSLRELTVHDVMVPRNGIAYLSGNRSYEDNLDVIRRSGHSRFPFTPSGDLDDVEGVVLAKELLFLDHDLPEDAEVDWAELMSPLLVVPEGKHLDEVLRLFQDQRKHLAVVVDEYGGTQGVVTLEDVIEEIVGEIEDETDRVERLITKKGGKLVCRGWAETRKLFRVLGVEQKVEAVTVGGLVADELGRVPQVGDVVEWNNIRFKVTKASRRRADEIEVSVEGRPPIESLTGSGERPSASEPQI